MPGDYYYEELEEGRFGDLLWFDEDAGIAFSLHGMIPKEDMIGSWFGYLRYRLEDCDIDTVAAVLDELLAID